MKGREEAWKRGKALDVIVRVSRGKETETPIGPHMLVNRRQENGMKWMVHTKGANHTERLRVSEG